MKIVSWNIRGLRNSRHVRRLKSKIRAINPRILLLMETKLSAKNMEMARRKLGFIHGIDVDVIGTKGGLALCWKDSSLVSLRSYSSFHIDADIHDTDIGESWRLTGFYGCLEERNRHISWDLLRRLAKDNNGP